jgi:hypothetical protein
VPPSSSDIPITSIGSLYLGNRELPPMRQKRRLGIIEFLLRPFRDIDARAEYQMTARRAQKERALPR